MDGECQYEMEENSSAYTENELKPWDLFVGEVMSKKRNEGYES